MMPDAWYFNGWEFILPPCCYEQAPKDRDPHGFVCVRCGAGLDLACHGPWFAMVWASSICNDGQRLESLKFVHARWSAIDMDAAARALQEVAAPEDVPLVAGKEG
jgi:hypothetical protein